MNYRNFAIIVVAPGLFLLSACEQPVEEPGEEVFEATDPAMEERFQLEEVPDPNTTDSTMSPELAPPAADPATSEASSETTAEDAPIEQEDEVVPEPDSQETE